MRILLLVGSGVLFLAVLGLAARNSDPVTLHYYLGVVWRAPLVVMLLIFFGTGVALGMVACLGVIVRQRRQVGALKRQLAQLQSGHYFNPTS